MISYRFIIEMPIVHSYNKTITTEYSKCFMVILFSWLVFKSESVIWTELKGITI